MGELKVPEEQNIERRVKPRTATCSPKALRGNQNNKPGSSATKKKSFPPKKLLHHTLRLGAGRGGKAVSGRGKDEIQREPRGGPEAVKRKAGGGRLVHRQEGIWEREYVFRFGTEGEANSTDVVALGPRVKGRKEK